MARLIFIDKNFAGRTYELLLEKTTVGRGDQNTLVIRDSSLSSTHCEILMHGSEIIVRDLDSSNGTFVEGTRLNKQSQVKSGQTVRFGSVEARLELDSEGNETDTAEITAIYALGKVMREQRRAKNHPQPDTASMELEPEAHPAPEEHTILLPRSALPERPPVAPAPDKAQSAPAKAGTGKLALLIAAVVVVLALLLWLIFGRK